MTDSLDAGLELLDRQVVDMDGRPLGKVDDLLFTEQPDAPPVLTALLIGQQAFGARLGGRAGHWWTRLAQRLSPYQGPSEVPVESIRKIATVVTLDRHAEDFPQLLQSEKWLRRHLVTKLPGGERESD